MRFFLIRSQRSKAILTVCTNLSSSNGFATKSYAPSFKDSTAVSIVPYAVIIMTTIELSIFLTCLRSSIPSIPGIFISARTTLTGFLEIRANASFPLSDVLTSTSSSPLIILSISISISCLSSTMSTEGFMISYPQWATL